MESLASRVLNRSCVMSRLAELDLIIKQTELDLHETRALIERLREHYLHAVMGRAGHGHQYS